MRTHLIAIIICLAFVTGCTTNSSKEQRGDINQEELQQSETEIVHLDSLSSEAEAARKGIESDLEDLDELLKEME